MPPRRLVGRRLMTTRRRLLKAAALASVPVASVGTAGAKNTKECCPDGVLCFDLPPCPPEKEKNEKIDRNSCCPPGEICVATALPCPDECLKKDKKEK